MATRANGVLFKNDRKTGSRPDYNGNITITPEVLAEWQQLLTGKAEVKLDLAGWFKTSSGGKNYMSLACSAPYKKDDVDERQSNRPAPSRNDDW